jgi:hypothetical protein
MWVWAVVAFGGHPAMANLIVNGDFEGGDAPWVFVDFAFREAGGNPGQCVRLESNGVATSDPTASQTVAGLTTGQSYTLSWDWRPRINFSGSGNGPSFGVFLDTQAFANALFLGTKLTTPYLTSSAVFTATAATHTFIFAGELDGRSNGAGTTDVSYKLDNVALNANAAVVPEPGTLAGLAGGLLVLARRRRVT